MSLVENAQVMNAINSYSSVIDNTRRAKNIVKDIKSTIETVDNNQDVAVLLTNINILKQKMLLLHGLYLYDDSVEESATSTATA